MDRRREGKGEGAHIFCLHKHLESADYVVEIRKQLQVGFVLTCARARVYKVKHMEALKRDYSFGDSQDSPLPIYCIIII